MAQIAQLEPVASASASPKPAAQPSRWAPSWQALPSLVNSLVLALVGFALNGHVEQALKDRQAQVASVKAMGELLSQLASDTTKSGERQNLARQLSMYGVDAIGPLIVLGLTIKLPINHSAEGLSLIAIHHKQEVCDALDNALQVRALFADAPNQVAYLEDFAGKLQCAKRRSWWTF